jgi:hypothetical protein
VNATLDIATDTRHLNRELVDTIDSRLGRIIAIVADGVSDQATLTVQFKTGLDKSGHQVVDVTLTDGSKSLKGRWQPGTGQLRLLAEE